ncbi:MAG TPA: Gfo/Idh/MocA family oxidoreductase [Chloroflexota bacterium]|nr:Gfo/Idh/MocA family oxidoreductase [Chloroflexota bacterium]
MAEKVRVGLVGLGSVAQRGILPHTFEADARTRLEPVALCDAVPGRAEASAEKWNWHEAYADYEGMLREAEIDAVLIATPIPLHYQQIKAALQAGKHVFTQKTMTTALAEANDVVELARRKGLTLVAAPGEMLRPPWPQIKEVIDQGLIGRVYWALAGMQGAGHEHEEFRRSDDVLSNVDPTWYYKTGGGPVYDMTVYCLHELTGILGPVKRVSAMSGIGLPVRQWKEREIAVEMDDNTHIVLDFGDSTFGFAFGANCRGGPLPRFAVFGTEGTVEAGNIRRGAPAASGAVTNPVRGGPYAKVVSPKVEGGEKMLDLPEMPYRVGRHREIGEAHGYLDIMHFVECIQEKKRPIPSGEHARHVIEIIEKAYRSAREGRTLELESTL